MSRPGKTFLLVAITTATFAVTASAAEFAASTATSRALFAGPGDVDSDSASIQLCAVHGGNGLLRLRFRAHGYEAKATGAIGGAIYHEVGFGDCAVRGKRVVEVVFSGVEGKISYKQFIIHVMYLLSP